jgi:hypothetical protein
VADFFLSPLLEFVGLINQFDTVAVEFAFCCEFWLISEKLAWCSCNSQSSPTNSSKGERKKSATMLEIEKNHSLFVEQQGK